MSAALQSSSSPDADAAEPKVGATISVVPSSDGSAPSEVVPTAAPKAKRKRAPQPTYEDGSTTRHFKFPSRTYPKSSYYITGTEIIIRIKKARKRWKLVIPKKRVASYKTNRWFAKPRWVEIELTYTQALKHGLTEPWTPSAEAGLPAETPVPNLDGETNDAASLSAPEKLTFFAIPEAAASLAEDEFTDDSEVWDEWVPPAEADDGAASAAKTDEAMTVAPEPVAAAEPDHIADTEGKSQKQETDEAIAPVIAASLNEMAERLRVEESPASPKAPGKVSLPGAHVIDRMAAPVDDDTSPHRRKRWAAVAALLMLLLGTGGWWLIAGRSADAPALAAARPPAETPPQASREPEQTVSVVAVPVQPPTPDSISRENVPAPAISSPEATSTLTIEMRPTEPDKTQVASVATPRSEPENNKATPDIVPPTREPKLAPVTPADAATTLCRTKIATAIEAKSIQFGYASADIPPAALPMLDRLASQLKSCPGVSLTIAGHTDSDGHLDRNQLLSVSRAERVRQNLIGAGVAPRSLAALGLGQFQPRMPNDTEANKRLNRRIEFVLQP